MWGDFCEIYSPLNENVKKESKDDNEYDNE